MLFRISRAKAHHLQRTVENIVRAKVLNRDHCLPWFAVYHANYACNASCSFCSQAFNINGSVVSENLPLEKVTEILRGILPLARSVYFAGGEPLLEKQIVDMLRIARDLGFWPVAVNTNGTLLDAKGREDLVRVADRIVVSVHAPTAKGAAGIFKLSEGLMQRTFDSIVDKAIDARRAGNQMVINCVLTPFNLEEAYGVLEFCQKHCITIAIVPAIVDYWPMIADADSAVRIEYQRFVEQIIELKLEDPSSVNGSMAYLRRIHSLDRIDCRPTAFVTIGPHGKVHSPCEYKYRGIVPPRLEAITSDRDAREILAGYLDYELLFVPCEMGCLKACYTQPAVAIENPQGALMDPEYLIFSRFARWFGVE